MSDDLIRRLRNLIEAHAAEDIDEAAYQRGLDKLRSQYGEAVVNAALEHLRTQQTPIVIGDTLNGDKVAGDKADRQVKLADSAQVAVANQGDVGRDMTLFTGEAHGNYIAEVINLYQQAPAVKDADYGAALRRYLKHLYASHATLDLRGIDDRPMDMPLSELYVSLTLHEPPPDALRGRGGLRSFVEKMRSWMGAAGDPEALAGGKTEAVDWSRALRHSRIAVVGAPGSGKTTLLHYTTVRLAEVLARDDSARLADLGLDDAAHQGAPPVPLLLPLRELGAYLDESKLRETTGANPRLLLDCLANYYGRFNLELPPDFFSRLCDAGRAILLLDGLDEVVRSSDRALVSGIVRSFATRYDRCRYVVTARIAAYQGDAQIGAGFRICTVADLDADQQQRFIANWSRSLHRLLYTLTGAELEHAAARYADSLWAALETNARVRDLATNPLLLTVVAVIFYNNYVLPEDRAALYEECVEVLLRGGRGKADKAGQQREEYGGRPELSMGRGPKRELLAAVANTMHCRGEEGIFVSRDELVHLVQEQLRNRPDARAAAQLFVDELPVHIGLLDEREPDRFRFSHLSFQEFLAARHIAEATEDRWGDLLDRYQDSWWREVILLCAGHLSSERCWRFLGQLIERGTTPDEHAAALGLAAAALGELERFKGQGPLNARIVQEALAILEAPPKEAPAAARVTCGRVLAQLGDPRPGVCTLPPPLVRFEGGSFLIGSTPEEARQAGHAYEQYFLQQGDKESAKRARKWPEGEVNSQLLTVPAFALARYPVTNAQYALFIADGGYAGDAPWWDEAGRAWLRRDDAATEGLERWQRRERKDQPRYWDDERFGQARRNHPVVGVSWYEAMAFCRWLTQQAHYNPQGYSYRLPSEAEWEFAARGVTRRSYAWGDEDLDPEHGNFDQTYGGTSAVGCFPLGTTPEGLHDMTGNVLEWTRSVYQSYPYDPRDGREHPSAPADKYFTLRGGSWYDRPISLRAADRGNGSPGSHNVNVGFRLARHLPS